MAGDIWQVSIPRSGFCSFKHCRGIISNARWLVSIPRSGFCSFKLEQITQFPLAPRCFNPSVGILFIQAAPGAHSRSVTGCFNPSVGILFIQALFHCNSTQYHIEFQSLGRDSVHSSPMTPNSTAMNPAMFQSLGRDSVHSSCMLCYIIGSNAPVSIPRSGFCSFKPVAERTLPSSLFVSIPRSGFCSFKPAQELSLIHI